MEIDELPENDERLLLLCCSGGRNKITGKNGKPSASLQNAAKCSGSTGTGTPLD
jgi:hypothetical protein